MVGKSASTDKGDGIEPIRNPNDIASENFGDGNGPEIIDPATLGGSNAVGTGTEYGDEYERDADGNLVYGASGKPRRKRGRKSGGGNSGGNRASSGGSGGSSTKSGSRNSQTLNDGIETLSKTLLIVHMGLASYAKFDPLQITKDESDALSSSIVNVMDQFDFVPDPRFTAVAGLVTTAATIYGPRIYLYREHVKELAEKRRQEKGIPQNVEQFTSNGIGNTDLGLGGPYGNLGG